MLALSAVLLAPAPGAAFDAAPFGVPLPEGAGILWEDPREIHRVVARFREGARLPAGLRLEYWGSRWPEQRLPKDREPGGGSVGWWELGNWYNGGWRAADAAAEANGAAVTFTFRPVNAKEFPAVRRYAAPFRYTLKLRLVADGALPPLERLEAYTDSVWAERTLRVVWRAAPRAAVRAEAFNGAVAALERDGERASRLRVLATENADPNSFDRTLVTLRRGRDAFTFRVDDALREPVLVPHLGVAVLPASDARTYAQVEVARRAQGASTLHARIAGMAEQTWPSAWRGMPAKKRDIYVPLGLDGGRQRFRLDADGSLTWRFGTPFLFANRGRDTDRLTDREPLAVLFGLPDRPVRRGLADGALPLVTTEWERDGLRYEQDAFVTRLEGTRASDPPPAGDDFAVCMVRLTVRNPGAVDRDASVTMTLRRGDADAGARLDAGGALVLGDAFVGMVAGSVEPRAAANGALEWLWRLAPGGSASVLVKLPYVPLRPGEERERLAALDFDREREGVAGYWARRTGEGMRLLTPEVDLADFHRAHAAHLLINCEREPASGRRFARVGSFHYGAYGNESCMMVTDLDRRGLHAEARECLDAWLHYQGTVGLPGDFSTKEGVLYGAGGYESGGYNQHHGWILWCLGEHYRFTRDRAWLEHVAPGILAGAEWIVRERARTAKRKDIARGLLPAGSLEDIGDWWPWLSTNCYTWRGLDTAAWALAQIDHPEAPRLRREADDYRAAILRAFGEASQRAPVVKLRDGTWVPKVPSMVYRRGRAFGWICETLEGALHLLIAGVLDPRSPLSEWIVKDYEDNLYLSNQYGYVLPDFERHWFGRGGMSMQSCLLLDVEPYLQRDEPKHALRALFNAIAVGFFPDVRMITEHALPQMGDYAGDHYKSSDEANAAGWLRQILVRESGDDLLIGQAAPAGWLADGKRCGVERAATHFGPMSAVYEGGPDRVTLRLDGPRRNPPKRILVRFRDGRGRPVGAVTVNGKRWADVDGDWVRLPGNIGRAEVVALRGGRP